MVSLDFSSRGDPIQAVVGPIRTVVGFAHVWLTLHHRVLNRCIASAADLTEYGITTCFDKRSLFEDYRA